MGKQKGAKDEKTTRAITAIGRILGREEHPQSIEGLTQALNEDGIPRPRDTKKKGWDADYVRDFCDKEEIALPFEIPDKRRARKPRVDVTAPHYDTTGYTTDAIQTDAPHLLGDDTTAEEPPGENQEATTSVSQSVVLPPLDAETMGVLLEMAEWWKTRKDQDMLTTTRAPQMTHRPNFPGLKRNSGIRINERLLVAALEKAKTPEEAKKLGGGGLSPLIERLFWQYLDYDQQFLEPEE